MYIIKQTKLIDNSTAVVGLKIFYAKKNREHSLEEHNNNN